MYSNKNIINGVRYTDEYQNTNEKSKLLAIGKSEDLSLQASNLSKINNTRSTSKFSRNNNFDKLTKSLEKESGNSYSVGNFK